MGGCCSKPKTKEAPPPPRPKPVRPKTPVQEAAPLSPRSLRMRELEAGKACPYLHGKCTIQGGDVKACFAEGLVYRIIKDGAWYIYNDTLDYDAHVNYRFGPGSEITPGERTTLEQMEDGWTCAHAVVHPLETVLYISGPYNGYKSDITAVPLSDEYRHSITSGANAVAAAELRRVEELAGGEIDDEALLRLCVSHKVPFVDVNFPPTAEMLARERLDGRSFPEMAMQRPTQYLPLQMRKEADAVLGPVVPQSVHPGHLGDSWLMCAAAILAESEPAVKALFKSAQPAEKAVGGYRVALSKHGWWRSVIVDSYLPTINGVPAFGHVADDPREQWVALFQKAYAKVHGSYASITGGDALQALQDFTGAPLYRFDKEWEAAASDAGKARALRAKLLSYIQKGYSLVLNTPGHDSGSYLGARRNANPEAFKTAFQRVGLRSGYTYYVTSAEAATTSRGAETLLLKLRNPWARQAEILCTPEWNSSAANREMRQAAAAQNIMCVSWEDALNYFDGGGVVYTQRESLDYRVQGWFDDVQPHIVLEVTASEPVEVMLVLSQPDKRGVSTAEPQARYAPIMLSVSQADDHDKQRVQVNTSWDAESPSTDYNFVVARDVAMKYTFQPSHKPYMVIPRIHRKGVKPGYVRPYVLGIIAKGSLEGKLNIEMKQLNKENRVFKNITSFVPENMFTVEVEHQLHQRGALPTTRVSSTLTSAVAPKRPTPSEKSASASEQHSAEASSHDEEVAVQLSPEQISITNADGEAEVEVAEREVATPVADDMPASKIDPKRPMNSDEDSL